jgi:hypothetical protein
MEKKFIKLIETTITALTRGGFQVGNYVKFVKNYKSKKEYKDLNDSIKEEIDRLAKSKLNVRVVGINDKQPLRYPGNADLMNGEVILALAEDQGGGRTHGNVFVPTCLCKVVDHYPNLAPLPDEWNYDNKEIHKPVEVKAVDGGTSGITYELPKTDTKIKPSSSKKKTVNKESYTSEYLSGMEHLR